MTGELDSTDVSIIRTLQDDARVTNAQIARELGVSEETVRRRVGRLRQRQLIYIVGIPDPTKLGFESQSLIGVKVAPDKFDEVSEALAALPEVSKVVITTGSFDVFAWVTMRTTDDLRSFLRDRIAQIAGVQRTETFVEMVNKKRTHGVPI